MLAKGENFVSGKTCTSHTEDGEQVLLGMLHYALRADLVILQ